MIIRRLLGTGLAAWIGFFANGAVSSEPLTVIDIAGREVTFAGPVERFVISEGRYVPLLALLRPDNPVGGLVGMMSPLSWTQPDIEAQLFERFPEAQDIKLFGHGSADSVSVEQIIELEPQLAIFGLSDHGPGARNAELLAQLRTAGIPVLFIDFRLDPLANTLPSIALMGKVLGAMERAEAYLGFYRERLERIAERGAGASRRPTVFVQVHPGRRECCWGMADGMFGPVVGLVGGTNIADAVAPGPTSQHTEEFLLTEDPDVWIGTASGTVREYVAGYPPVALGPGMSREAATESLSRYLSAPAFQAMAAVRNGRAHVIWHNFYNSPFNIVAFEAFAKWIRPDLFGDLDPERTLEEIYSRFLPFELSGVYSASISDGG